MNWLSGKRALRAAFLAALMIAPLSAQAIPPDGAVTETRFCGTVDLATQAMTNHGIELGEPYIGVLELTQRFPDVGDEQTISTEWECTQEGFECGEFRVTLQNFAPPQTQPDPSDIFGPVAGITQTTTTYHLNADLDDFVIGPATLGAIGLSQMQLLCVACQDTNNQMSIKPDFKDLIGDVSGLVIIQVQIPGMGGSLAPPEGNQQDVRLNVTRLGGGCNKILPATSSWGLVALVGLMVVTSIFFAGRRGATENA